VKRAALLALVVVALTACEHTQRPEGIVERWLQSLDQGRAGTPERYADDQLSEQVLPRFRTLDPGQFDVIEVGSGRPRTMGPAIVGQTDLAIPFRVVTTDGIRVRGAAWLSEDGTRIALVRVDDPEAPLPSEGGPRLAEVTPAAWLIAAAIAGVLSLVGVGLMVLVARSARPTA
jgi:hypothetical protein